MSSDLQSRIGRLEALRDIKLLSFKYAQAIDARDLEAVASLYLADYQDAKLLSGRSGREVVKNRLSRIVRLFTTSIHIVGNQVIAMDDEDHARGVVFTRAEHEVGNRWVVMVLHYWDKYERRDGHWYFSLRRPHRLYTTDLLERPTGPLKSRWPGLPAEDAPLPHSYPSWDKFWGDLCTKEASNPIGPTSPGEA